MEVAVTYMTMTVGKDLLLLSLAKLVGTAD